MTQTVMARSRELENLRIASPCPAKWSEMLGDHRVRYCALCRLNVYNVAELNEAEALDLIDKAEGRLCMLLLRRADGTLITRDCSVGRGLIRRRLVLSLAAAAAVLIASFSWTVRTGVKKTFRTSYEEIKTAFVARAPIRSWMPQPRAGVTKPGMIDQFP